jgi:hypothetical protein
MPGTNKYHRAMKKEQFKDEIIKYFTTYSGLSVDEAKEKIRNQMIKDEYDNEVRTGNVKLFYTDNENYCGGEQNGYGSGWYISNQGFTGGSQIKI